MGYVKPICLPELKSDATPGRLVDCQDVPPCAADGRDGGVAQPLGRVTVHHHLDISNVLRRPAWPGTTRVRISWWTLWVAVVDCAVFHLLIIEVPHCFFVWDPYSREFELEIGHNSLEEVSASPSLCILKEDKIPLFPCKLGPWRHPDIWNTS